MRSAPIANDPQNPLISVLIYNYYGEHLRQCFDGIFEQSSIKNIEVILIDNASSDGSWDIAIEYARRYEGFITLKRNSRSNRAVSPSRKGMDAVDTFHCLRMAMGKYIVTLCKDEAFVAHYISQCIAAMESDPFVSFDKVRRRVQNNPEWPSLKEAPRVNVLIHNYNYGRYLRQCLDSVFAQTYPNIDIIFSDNASTDESWEIANEYATCYPGIVTLLRNRRNFGPAVNLENCYDNIDGKYFCVLCSDDALMPDFVEKCVLALEAYPDAGFAVTHRAIIDEHGSLSEEPPFYNRSCVIPGPEQAAVYMMAAVNPSISQVMYDRDKAIGKIPAESLTNRWFAQRLLDFNLCCHHSMVYIKEPLLLHRMHSASDSIQVSSSLLEAFGQFILPHQFVHIASSVGNMDKATERLPMALEKLSKICIRYCVRALCSNDARAALRYFHLAVSVMPEIADDLTFRKLQEYWTASSAQKTGIVEVLRSTDNLLTRSVSYEPPPGSIPIEKLYLNGNRRVA